MVIGKSLDRRHIKGARARSKRRDSVLMLDTRELAPPQVKFQEETLEDCDSDDDLEEDTDAEESSEYQIKK